MDKRGKMEMMDINDPLASWLDGPPEQPDPTLAVLSAAAEEGDLIAFNYRRPDDLAPSTRLCHIRLLDAGRELAECQQLLPEEGIRSFKIPCMFQVQRLKWA